MQYIKQLDSLRALAVFLVIIHHWFAPTHLLFKIFAGTNKAVGVTFFFVLSGFLITSILLHSSNYPNKLVILKNFYIRRALRIFPVYYLTIFIVYVFFSRAAEGDNIANLPYYLLHATNVLMFIKQEWAGSFTHLWSLAVQEQLYLTWPWLIVFTPQKYTIVTIIGITFIGIGVNFITPEPGFPEFFNTILLDSFGLGGLLAYFYWKGSLPAFRNYIYLVALFAAVPFALNFYFNINTWIPFRTTTSILAIAVIAYAIKPNNSLFHKWVLSNPILIFMGKFSYGLYLFHAFVPKFYGPSKLLAIPLFNKIIPQVLHGEVMFVEYFGSAVLIAWLSWRFIEMPINKLKRNFIYDKVSSNRPNL